MEKKTYQTKRKYTKHQKLNKVRNIVFIGISLFALGMLLGNKVYTEYILEKYVTVPEVKAQEVPKETMKEWVLRTVKEAGIDPYEAYAIINCESHWNDLAINKNKDGSFDIGLFQINERYWKNTDRKCKLDFRCNTFQAIEIYKKSNSWKAWTCKKVL